MILVVCIWVRNCHGLGTASFWQRDYTCKSPIKNMIQLLKIKFMPKLETVSIGM